MDASTTSQFPVSTTGDVHMDYIGVDESKAENNEELIELPEETIYGDFPDLEEIFVQSVIQTSLIETSMVGSSGSSVANVTPSNNFQIDGAIVYTRPFFTFHYVFFSDL